MKKDYLLGFTIFFMLCAMVSLHYGEGTIILLIFGLVSAIAYLKRVK